MEDFGKKQMIVLAFELGYIIAIPVLFLGLIGKYLDARWGTNPVFVIIGLLLAITASTIWLYRRFSAVFREFKKKDIKNEQNHNDSDSAIGR